MSSRDRRPRSWLTASLAVAGIAAFAVVGAKTEDDAPALSMAGVDARATDVPGRAVRLDASQTRRAAAQSVADRFARAFAAYLSGTASPADLRSAGASPELVRQISDQPTRSAAGAPRQRNRATDIAVESDGSGWLATAALRASQRTDGTSIPLAFRLEQHGERLTVVDLNAGGQE